MYSYDRRAARPIPVDKGQALKLAQRIVRELPAELRFRPEDMAGPINQARGYRAGWVLPAGTFLTTDVKGDTIEVPVRVKFQALEGWGVRRWVAGGGIDTRFFGGRSYGSKLALDLYLNSNAVVHNLLDHLDEVEDELFSVIIHEATHLRDLLKHEYAADEAGSEDYYNAPTEVRAFMQQTADEALKEADRLGKTSGGWILGPEPTSEMIDSLLEKSKTWERIRKQLTPANGKLILRGVARVLQNEWPNLRAKYKKDDWP
jgi:hypothetical protein